MGAEDLKLGLPAMALALQCLAPMPNIPSLARFWIRRVLASAIGFACTLAAMSYGWQLLDTVRYPCRRGPAAATRIHLMALKDAAESFVVEHKHCPQSLHEVAYSVHALERRRDLSWLNDAWGERVALACIPTDDGPVIATLSAGPDRKFGTDDDLSSTQWQ